MACPFPAFKPLQKGLCKGPGVATTQAVNKGPVVNPKRGCGHERHVHPPCAHPNLEGQTAAKAGNRAADIVVFRARPHLSAGPRGSAARATLNKCPHTGCMPAHRRGRHVGLASADTAQMSISESPDPRGSDQALLPSGTEHVGGPRKCPRITVPLAPGILRPTRALLGIFPPRTRTFKQGAR